MTNASQKLAIARVRSMQAAHVAVKKAVKAGTLKRPSTCSQCDAPGRIEGHHEDYSKPIDVIWLCHACHRGRHRNGLAFMKLLGKVEE